MDPTPLARFAHHYSRWCLREPAASFPSGGAAAIVLRRAADSLGLGGAT